MNATSREALPKPEDLRYRAVQRVTVVGTAIDALLGFGKILVGWMAHSQALIADGVHSLSDLATDVLVLVAAKHANREADDEHPYGHGRIETLATVGLGGALIAVSVGIGYDAVYRLFHPELLLTPTAWALVAAVASVLIKEWLYQYTVRVARKVRSPMLKANAWHHRSDAISSVVVVVGVAGTLAGLPYIDAVAAAGVAGMIAKIGWDLAWHSLRELIDTGLEQEKVERIRKEILAVDGVSSLHMLRTRRMGGSALVDVHLILEDPKLSVSEGHQISESVRARLINSIDDVEDVTVHIDPEDDELAAPNRYLPLRKDALARLERCWAEVEAARHIEHVNLHYLDGKLHVEVILPLQVAPDAASADAVGAALRAAVSKEPDIAGVRLLLSATH